MPVNNALIFITGLVYSKFRANVRIYSYLCEVKIKLLTMGKTDVQWVREGLELYVARLSHYVPFTLQELPQLKKASSLSPEQIKEKEGEMLLAAVRPSDEVILLDEHGRELRSVEFAAFIQEKMNRGKDLVFTVGGAYGFAPKVYDRADGKISLSKMTFSHQMVRTIAAEQLYRAFTIIKGEPYHNE